MKRAGGGGAAARHGAATGPGRLGGLLVFATAFAVRLLAWRATPDAAWAGSARYVGDADLWLAYARSLVAGRPFELGLPLRPPGNAWLLSSLLGAGGGVGAAKLLWCLLGALVCWLVYRAVRPAFGYGAALACGLLCAGSTALVTLSTSLNNETPYLAVAVATLALGQRLEARPAAGRAALWGALGAAGCLLRAEHLLFVLLAAGWHAAAAPALRRRGVALAAAAGFLLPLVPWHAAAWGAIARFNAVPPPTAAERAQADLERALAARVAWAPEAAAVRDRWPAFARRTAANFVAATVAHRGRRRVEAADLAILDDAFAARPAPLSAHPFVALYGGLNFHLANHAGADGGFSRRPLERAPPLAGGAARYPAPLVAGLPPPDLTLAYPPHLAAVEEGWRLGGRWIAAHPGDAAALAGRKLSRFWAGAALGLTGYGLPLGETAVRWPVDLAVPRGGGLATAWRWLVLAAALAGVAAARPRRALVPWLLYAASRLAAALLFFGYARVGATVVPVVALSVVLAARWGWRRLAARFGWPAPAALSPRRALAAAAAAALLLVAVEAVRWADPPRLTLDGRPVTAAGPFAPDDPDERALGVAGGG